MIQFADSLDRRALANGCLNLFQKIGGAAGTMGEVDCFGALEERRERRHLAILASEVGSLSKMDLSAQCSDSL